VVPVGAVAIGGARARLQSRVLADATRSRRMTTLLAPAALLDDGWQTDVAIVIDGAGRIAKLEPHASAASAGERLKGPVIPAMPNVHSHAFQRAIAGRVGTSSSGDDTFWTWRQAMYAAVDRLDADAFEAIATQAYVEMARAGYASVGEFHYVHHDPHGKPYADPAELAWRIVGAAETAEIGLTLLPVFYAHADFGGAASTPLQRRFVQSVYTYEKLCDALARGARTRHYMLGVAPHSLRAVTPQELAKIVQFAPPGAPIHIHAAEQTREVDDCCKWSGERPVEWLLAHANVDARWCIVHATHMTEREVAGLAGSGAVTGLAPCTEADLGDGIFPGEAYVQAGGRFGIGSDSNTAIDPFAELRQLEWSQRLRLRRRNVLAGNTDAPIGEALWCAAARGGGQALGVPTGRLAPGLRADLIVLDVDDPALAEQPLASVLDAAIFGPCRRPVRDLMSGGRWIVRDGHHAREHDVLRRFRAALARIKLSAH
jgi:formimidoylglutamate deiminase